MDVVDPYVMFVLTRVESDPGIGRSRLYACDAHRRHLNEMLREGLLEEDEGFTLTGDGQLLLSHLKTVCALAGDTRYKDVGERVDNRYRKRLAYMKAQRDGL